MATLLHISDFSMLNDSRESWNALAGDRPFFRWEWISSWVRYLGKDLELVVLVQTDSTGKWTGIAPLGISTSKTGARCLQFLGSGSACTDYATLICSQQNCESFVADVAQWLIANFDGKEQGTGFDLIEFDGVADDDVAVNLLAEVLEQKHFGTFRDELEGCWVVDLPESWQELNSSFSKSLRRKSNAAARRLASEDSDVRSSRDAGIDSVWPEFVELHQQRREMLGQPGCFASSEFESFLKAATEQLAAAGLAEVVVIESEGNAIASALSFNDGTTKMMYQTGFDVQRQSESLGYLLVVQSLQSGIDREFKQFDFLRGDEPYKSRWKTKRVALTRIRMVPPKLSATIRHGLFESARSVKSMLNQSVASLAVVANLMVRSPQATRQAI